MVDTLQAAMEDALVRQQFYADGEASYQETLRTNAVFDGANVKAYVMSRLKRVKSSSGPRRPQALRLDAAKPMTKVHD
jgi:hypothetical protein